MYNQRKWFILFLLLTLTMGNMSAKSAKAEAAATRSTVIESFTSNALLGDSTLGNNELTYKVYLPKGYDPERVVKYPVIYLLHGSHGDENGWDDFWGKLDSMIESGIIEPVIAVAPKSGNSYWVDSVKFGNYESAVIQDLIPRIDSRFNTKADRSGRFIMGYSMGGYGALRYSMVYPELFGATTLLSPAIQNKEAPSTSGAVERGAFGVPFDPSLWDAKNYPTSVSQYVYKVQQNPDLKVPVYIVTCDDDWNHLSEKEDLPSDAYKYNMEVQAVQLYEELHRKNLFSQNFDKWADVPASPAELRIINGGHNTDVWLKGFEEGLKYMFGKTESAEFKPTYNASTYTPTNKGTLTPRTLTANQLVNDLTPDKNELPFTVYLPKGYDPDGTTEYPVMYLLHGSGGTANSWNKFWPILDTMIEQGKIQPVIAVAPVTGNSYWVDSRKYGDIESAVIQDLIPYMDQNYRTISKREGRGLVGFSMGGYGALRYSLVYPELFGAATLLSPFVQQDEAPATSGAVERGSFGEPFDPNVWTALNYPSAIQNYGAQSNVVPMFIITGDDDWNHLSEKEDLPADAYKYNMEVQAVTLYQNIHRKNIFNKPFEKWDDVPASPAQLRILNGGHDMEVWATGFEQGLPYMFANGILTPQQAAPSTAPTAASINVVNNPSGQQDVVVVSGLSSGVMVNVYSSLTGGNLLGSGVVAQGQTSITIEVGQLGAAAGSIYVSVKAPGKRESVRTLKNFSVEATTILKPFTISAGTLSRGEGLQASITIARTDNTLDHNGKEVVVFQLIKGKKLISVVALQKDIQQEEQLMAYFNESGNGYTVRAVILDSFSSSLTQTGNSLSNAVTLQEKREGKGNEDEDEDKDGSRL